jgi:TonB family protein
MRTELARSFCEASALLVLLISAAGPALSDGDMSVKQIQAGDSVSTKPDPSSNQNDTLLSLPSTNDKAPSDPDNTPAMQALWLKWQIRMADLANQQFRIAAMMHYIHGGPISCTVSYTVNRTGQISNVRVIESSHDPVFDTKLLASIKGLSGLPILKFPPDSKRELVEKTSNFKWIIPGPMQPSIGDFGPHPGELVGPFPGFKRSKPGLPGPDDD